MKSFIVRAAVVALVLTGAAASTQVSAATTSSKTVAGRTSIVPVPRCAPDDPNACGLR